MKRIAYYALHYGKEFLAWSIRSIQEAVDEIVILYSDRPSFGHSTELSCPDQEAELKEQAHRFLKKPLHWQRGHWGNEGSHRNEILNIARDLGAQQLLVVDADELWAAGQAELALNAAEARPERNVLVRFTHFWRSFKWICKDPCMPVRIVNLTGNGTWYLDPQLHPVLHFGYAQRIDLIRYKQAIHGHKNEWRPRWFEETFLKWTPGSMMGDLHPTNVSFWSAEQIDKQLGRVLAELLCDHPYWDKDIIV